MLDKLIRLSPTGIEYGAYAWNFYSGCRHKEQRRCPPVPCWAEELTKRFKNHYPNGFDPTFYPDAFLSPLYLPVPKLAEGKKPLDYAQGKRILVNFMGDMFGDWVDPDQAFSDFAYYFRDYRLKEIIKMICCRCPQHIFVFLTKNPAGMIPWSPFPDNCQVGFSAWSPESFIEGLRYITRVEAKVKWCSLEPLLDWSPEFKSDAWGLLDWVVPGALTGTKRQIMELAPKYPALTPWSLGSARDKGNQWGLMPPVAWLKTIVEGCAAAKVPVFIKNNLGKWISENMIPGCEELFYTDVDKGELRQELPVK